MRRSISTLVAACRVASCEAAFAMQQCPSLTGWTPTSPCATAGQAIVGLALPAALAAALVYVSRRSIKRSGLRWIVVSAIVVACVLWQLLAIAVLAGFLAPCSATCWY